jgi:preprotein translocase subunit SecA
MEDRRWSLGIHEAVEIKENVDVGGGTKQRVLSRTKTFYIVSYCRNDRNWKTTEKISRHL